jgi:hypothetical protein
MVSTVSITQQSDDDLRCEATALLRDPKFLFHVSKEIEAQGVVGEKRNGLALVLTMLTAKIDPVSALVAGPSSSGKSNLVRAGLRLMPHGVVIERSSMSAKAPVHGKEPLGGKILYLTEQRGGKDAQYHLRLLQSEGSIAHEFATVEGRNRATKLAERSGVPVVITTTTAEHVFEDDATRCFSLAVDQTEEQTRAILKAELRRASSRNTHQLVVIRKAVEILREHKINFEIPDWFETVAEHVPATLRSRRDWPRFLSLCKALTLIRVHRVGKQPPAAAAVNFEDYAVAHRLLNRVFSKTAATMQSATDQVINAVEILYDRTGSSVSIKDVARFLRWEDPRVYKHVKLAVRQQSVDYDLGTCINNEKRLVPRGSKQGNFLLSPRRLLRLHPALGGCEYVDPITGNTKVIPKTTVFEFRD